MTERNYDYPLYAKFLHMGLAMFGVTAYLTAELAENGQESTGYLLHAYLGLSLAAFLLMRAFPGFIGGGPLKFSGWRLFSRQQWLQVFEDIRGLFRLRMPERGMHEGIAGLVQAVGLLAFAWMGITGTGLFLFGDKSESDLIEMIEELHEIGEGIIPLYLMLHIGAVFAHSIAGKPVWKRMWAFKSEREKHIKEHKHA